MSVSKAPFVDVRARDREDALPVKRGSLQFKAFPNELFPLSENINLGFI